MRRRVLIPWCGAADDSSGFPPPPPPNFCVCVCVSFLARFRVLCGGGGFPLVLPSVLLYVFTVIIFLRVLVISFCVFFSLLAFSPLSLCPFPVFCCIPLSLLPLLILFLCLLLLFPLVLSWPFLHLLCSLFFLRLFFSSLFSSPPSPLPPPPFRSRFGFFFSLLWPLFLSFLFPFSSSCLSFSSSSSCLSFSSSFVLSLLLSSSFVSVSSALPSSSLHAGSSSFSSVLAASWWVPLLPLCLLSLWLSFSISLRFGLFWSSLFLVLVFSVPGFSFRTCVSSSLVGSFLCLCFCFCLLLSFLIFPLLCLFFLLFFYFVPSCRLCCCASLSGSFFLGFALLRSFLFPQPSSLWGGGGGCWLRRSDCAT